MHSRLWLILWTLGILFPMAFLGKIWPAFGSIFDAVFAADWMHVIMHAFLYGVLGYLLAQWTKPVSFKSILGLFALAFLVGCFHEGLQILTAGHWPGWPAEVFDLAVDLGGATLGLGFVRGQFLFPRKRKEILSIF